MPLPVTVGLVAAYDFQEGADPATLYDISGNGHNGVISSGVTWGGTGLHFDGTGYVDVGDLGNLGPDYTIIAVVKTEAQTRQIIFSRINQTANTPDGRGFFLAKHSIQDRFSLEQFDGEGRVSVIDRFPECMGKWVTVCARANASQMQLVTGPPRLTSPYPSSNTDGMMDYEGNYTIGRFSFVTSSDRWRGDIGYLAVYDRQLTDEEFASVQKTILTEMVSRGVPYPSQPISPKIVITLDDASSTWYTDVYPLATARNIPITTYLIPYAVGLPGRVTWEQINELYDADFDVECHSYDHADLTTLTESDLRANLEAVNAAFTSHGLPSPEHHSYPGGQRDVGVISVVAEYRNTGRGTSFDDVDIYGWDQDVDWYRLRGQTISGTTDVNTIKRQIDNAILGNYVLVLFTHDVSENPSASGLHIDIFEEILDYVAAKRDAGLIDPVTIDGLYRAMQGIRTHPATGPMTLHGEATGATYNKTVDYVGFVWGTTRLNNPEGTAPSASGYDSHWIAPAGDYLESKFAHTPKLAVGTYYYRAAAEVDGAWVYGEELTLTVAAPSTLPNLYPAKLGSPYTILTAPYTTGDVLMTIHDADKLETPPNVVCLSGNVAGEFAYTGRYGNTLTGVTALPGTPQATWGVGTFAFRGIAAYDLNALVETVERLKEQIAALQTPGE